MPKIISAERVEKIINAVRTHPDLNSFCDKKGREFCKKHNITISQLNFLIAIITAERKKENNK